MLLVERLGELILVILAPSIHLAFVAILGPTEREFCPAFHLWDVHASVEVKGLAGRGGEFTLKN